MKQIPSTKNICPSLCILNYQAKTLPNEEKSKQEWRKLFVCTQPFNFEYQYLQNVFWTLYWNMLAINNIVQIYTYLCTSVLTWWYVIRKPLISKVCFCYWCMLSVSFFEVAQPPPEPLKCFTRRLPTCPQSKFCAIMHGALHCLALQFY